MKSKCSDHHIDKNKIWNVAVAVAFLIYLGLTTAIVVVHKKIDYLRNTQVAKNPAQTPAHQQNMFFIKTDGQSFPTNDNQINGADLKGSLPETQNK